MSVYYKIYYKFVKQYATKSYKKPRRVCKAKNPKTLVALGKSWFFEEDRSNEKDTIRLPWKDSSEFRKVLVPLRKFHF